MDEAHSGLIGGKKCLFDNSLDFVFVCPLTLACRHRGLNPSERRLPTPRRMTSGPTSESILHHTVTRSSIIRNRSAFTLEGCHTLVLSRRLPVPSWHRPRPAPRPSRET